MIKKIGEILTRFNDGFHKLTKPVRHTVAKLADRIGLHKLSDKQLRIAGKLAKGFAIFAGAHAGLWFLFGLGGLAAYGLHSAGLAVSGKLGLASFTTGAIMGLKSVVFSGLLGGIHVRSTKILAERSDKSKQAIQPEILDPTDLGNIPGIGKPFGLAAPANNNTPALPQPAAAPPKVTHGP